MPASTIYTDPLPAVALLLSLQSSPRGCDSSWSPFPSYSPLMVSERSSPLSHREFLQKRQESRYKLEDKQELAGGVTVNTVTQKDWNVKIPRMIFSSLGSRTRTGGMSIWSISWSSQMMLSSQRPYTNSSLSMGKMENQGGSSSWDAAEEPNDITIHRIKRHLYVVCRAYSLWVSLKEKLLTLIIVAVFLTFGARDQRNFGHGWRGRCYHLQITPRQTWKSNCCYYIYSFSTVLTSCFLTLLSVVGVSITGHAGGEPPSQTGPLSLGSLVFHILPVPDDILLPLQLSDHHEELIFKRQFALRQVFILLLNSSVMAVLFLQLQ